MLAKIYVTYKKEVLDPQGKTVNEALKTLGFDAVEDVRVGKYFEIKLGVNHINTPGGAGEMIDQMCRKLLANPVIEEYSFELIDK